MRLRIFDCFKSKKARLTEKYAENSPFDPQKVISQLKDIKQRLEAEVASPDAKTCKKDVTAFILTGLSTYGVYNLFSTGINYQSKMSYCSHQYDQNNCLSLTNRTIFHSCSIDLPDNDILELCKDLISSYCQADSDKNPYLFGSLISAVVLGLSLFYLCHNGCITKTLNQVTDRIFPNQEIGTTLSPEDFLFLKEWSIDVDATSKIRHVISLITTRIEEIDLLSINNNNKNNDPLEMKDQYYLRLA